MADVVSTAVKAPKSATQLALDTLYTPRFTSPPFAAYIARQESHSMIGIYGYRPDGSGGMLFIGPMPQAWTEFSYHLGLLS